MADREGMVSAAQSNLISAALAPTQIGQQIDAAVAVKTLNVQREQGNAVLKLLDTAGQAGPQPGDALVAKATGLGGLIDMTA